MKANLFLAAALLTLSGCATVNTPKLADLPPGTPIAKVKALAGEPQKVVANADGTRSHIYTTQPSGSSCFLVQESADGLVNFVEDTLSETARAKIVRGMRREVFFARMCQPISIATNPPPYQVMSWNIAPLTTEQPRMFDVFFEGDFVRRTEVRTLYFQGGH